ncbi:adenylate cyclase [Clostridium butyricum]|uniref:adenylate cyclase n=1 Tax=Clostridium butyricum TaxID=1492 RepID=UPI0021066174|nr:adenylate cyclase [Clostridium butyricum]MCQ2019448.1 adenylate cyclase [Clostridium butyricum]
MALSIRSQSDIFKLALLLYDYLSQNGYTSEAKYLNQLADAGYPQSAQSLEALLIGFQESWAPIPYLPLACLRALDEAIMLIAGS